MLLFAIVFVIGAVTTVLSCMDRFEFCIPICFTSILVDLAVVAMLVNILINNFGAAGMIAVNEQRYQILTYQLENHIGKKELYNQIQDWNEDLAKGKAMQNDIWIGAFYPNIYDQFEFIELP